MDLGAVLASILIVLIMICIAVDVVMRYFLGRPQIWVAETTEISLLYVTLLASAWVLKSEGHVKMDLLVVWMSSCSRALLNAVTSIIGSIICLFVTWYGCQFTLDQFARHVERESLLHIPNGLIVIVVPIGFFMLLIQFVRRSCQYFTEWKSLRRRKSITVSVVSLLKQRK
jgi:C4-dicarboxylate transporter DctQ subunit